jgi:phage baseplate assembly protein W
MAKLFEEQINPLDFQPNIAIGVKLPITNGYTSTINLNYTTFDQIKTNLYNLILTEPGERYMLPTYGCGLRHKLFEQIVKKLNIDIESLIVNSINTWMPYVNIDDILINVQNEHTILIKLDFSIKSNPNQKDTLIIEQPIPTA